MSGNVSGDGGMQYSGRQLALSTASVMLVMFLGALSQTIVATALPRIVADLGGFDRYVWVATSYMVAATIAGSIAGGLSDLYGRKPFFVIGLLIFIIASCLLGTGRSMNEIIIYRAVQGLGGGIIMISSIVSVADLFPPEKRGRQQGLLTGMFGVASIIGPVLGGFVSEHYSWRWIFWLNIPIAVPVLILVMCSFRGRRPEPVSRRLDYPGMAVLALAVTSLLGGLSIGGVWYPWDSVQCMGLLIFGLAMASVFVYVEIRAKTPIMPLGLYDNRTVSVAMILVLFAGFSLYGAVLFLPLYFQVLSGFSPTNSANLLVPMLLGIVVGAILAGRFCSRTGGDGRLEMLVSTALTATGIWLVSRTDEATGILPVVTCIALMGMGLGGTLAVVSVGVQNAVPFRWVGAATAAGQFFRSVGGMMGLAIAGTVLTSGFRSRLEVGVSDGLNSSLPAGFMDSIQQDPGLLLGPVGSAGSSVFRTGREGIQGEDQLLRAADTALSGAVTDVFGALVLAAALSFVVALFFRIPVKVDSIR